MDFKKDIEGLLAISLSDKQLNQFETYYQFLIEYNTMTNLTRITDKIEVYYKHFYDSLTLAKTVDMSSIKSICDMGSGAGFPSIPLKLIYPHLEITIVDSLNKRIIFLQQLIHKLGLNHINLVHDRVEHFAIGHQHIYDLVTARALGSMRLIAEMALPMTKLNGKFIALKGINYENEIEEAKLSINILGGQISDVKKFELPNQFGTHVHIVIDKIKEVQGYPRHFSIMKKRPL